MNFDVCTRTSILFPMQNKHIRDNDTTTTNYLAFVRMVPLQLVEMHKPIVPNRKVRPKLYSHTHNHYEERVARIYGASSHDKYLLLK